MYETLPRLTANSFALPPMNSVTLNLSMPRPFAYCGILDRVGDYLSPSTLLQPEERHMILTERKAFLIPDSVWAFSRKEKSLTYAGNRTTVSRLQPRRCNYYAIQPHNNVVSNTFVAVYVRNVSDAFP